MIKILAVLLLAIAGFYLGYKLYKSNKENDQTVSMYATLTMICALVGGIVLISYLLLKGSPWTGENKVLMRYILVFCLAVSFVYLGGKLIIRGRRGDDRLTQIAGLSWVLVTLLASGYAISYVSKMNEGWTSEKQKTILSRCNSSIYNCSCYLEQSMKMFKNPDDMTKALSDEKNNKVKVENFNAVIDSLCPCGSSQGAEEVDF
jgi:hypothetical protein